MAEQELSERARYDRVILLEIVLKELKNNHLKSDYENYKERINDILVEAIASEARLTREMAGKIDKTKMADIEEEMRSILGDQRVDLIKKSFAIETYRIRIVEVNDQLVAEVHREEIEIEPDITLSTIKSIEKAIELQWASFVLELFLFLLSCVDISVDLSQADIKKVVKVLKKQFAQESASQAALNKCIEAWNEEGYSVSGKAKAIFYFMKDSYLLGIFWKIFKLFFNDTSTWEKVREIVKVVLILVAAFATDWSALLAKLALAVDRDCYLAEKIENLVKFSDMKEALQ